MSAARPLFIVAGVGGGTGTGSATARLFAKSGFSVALIARNKDSLDKLAAEINNAGGNAASFPIPSYSPSDIKSAFSSISTRFPNSEYIHRAALFNAGSAVWKPFLEISQEEVTETINTNFLAAWVFSQEAIKKLKESPVDERTGKGTLLFTGATASIRGNVSTSAFSAAKHAVRALSQSLAKEFGKEDIHVSHAIIDGGIITQNQTPPRTTGLKPESIAETYLWLAKQEKSSWTWEVDLRPSTEKW